MIETKSPQRWAIDLSKLLKARDGDERFPVDVKSLAKNYSQQVYPNDPITLVKGQALDGFEGCLIKKPNGKSEWGIIYNSAITSPGRINFTLAHEFGHYLVHRQKFPDGLQCSSEDMSKWDSEYGQIEQQANEFAATLLMPRDDFSKQITAKSKPNFDKLRACAQRYGVSLAAATLRWLQFTQRRAMFVVSRDGYILWSRSSPKAFRSGMFIKTVDVVPVEVPLQSLAAEIETLYDGKGVVEHNASVWLGEPCREETFLSEQHDMVYTILHFGDDPAWQSEDNDQEDTYERITSRTPGSSWLS